jgi:hypothetical protein
MRSESDPLEVVSIFGILLDQCLDLKAYADVDEVVSELLRFLGQTSPDSVPQGEVVVILIKLWNTGKSNFVF